MNRVRRRQVLLTVSAALLLAGFPVVPVAAAEPTWKVGLAEARITPEKPFWMAGFGARKEPAEAMLQDLWVKVLAKHSVDFAAEHHVDVDVAMIRPGPMLTRVVFDIDPHDLCAVEQHRLPRIRYSDRHWYASTV